MDIFTIYPIMQFFVTEVLPLHLKHIFLLWIEDDFFTRKELFFCFKTCHLSRLAQTRVYSEHSALATAGLGQQTTDVWL